MKKNIVIIVLVITTFFSLALAFIKSQEAEKNKGEAMNNLQQAEMHRKNAEEVEMRAVDLAAEAIRQKKAAEVARKAAEEALSKCKGR
ncbi:MAG: hypothetical protein JXR07_03145 [Reichenbachiella sp.]